MVARVTEPLERCAAYVATRGALAALRRASVGWPLTLAEPAFEAARQAVVATAESMAHEPTSHERRRCARHALEAALEVAARCDIADAMGYELGDAHYEATRAVAMLGLFLHASTQRFAEDEE